MNRAGNPFSLLTPTQVLRRLTVVEDVNQQAATIFYDTDIAMESGVRKAVHASLHHELTEREVYHVLCFGFQCFLRSTHWYCRWESVGAVVQRQTCIRGDTVLCDRISIGNVDGRLKICGCRWRGCQFRFWCWFRFHISRLGVDGFGGGVLLVSGFLDPLRGIGGLRSAFLLTGILFLWLLLRCDRYCVWTLWCRCWRRCRLWLLCFFLHCRCWRQCRFYCVALYLSAGHEQQCRADYQ